MRQKLALLIASLFLVFGAAWAQAPVATPTEAITGLLNRIGGNGAADKFEIVIDASLAENGKDVFVITSQNGKPCIKGNTQLSVATGINWYLNHYAHINLTWNNLTTDLVSATLPVPGSEEKHVCNTTYRYNFNTCTFSYSMAFWTWERWQQEIDWMALHGINAPLNLVGLEVVTRNFLKELGVSETDIDNYIAGPGFMAWFAMNNLEGWGGTINATDVTMNGNPDWWYTRQELLCRNMLQRMRELGMQPVIPGFSGQVPNCITKYTIEGFNSGDVVNGGTWAGGYERPDILKPFTDSYENLASVYYEHLEAVMGVSEFYSMDPFHEGSSLPSGITAENTWPNIMAELDTYYGKVSEENKTKYSAPEKPKWIIQKWQELPPGSVFSTMSDYPDYKERFIGLDLFADNIYAGNAAFWQGQFYAGCPYIYCMLHNFGGRSGMHGRLETTMDGYFDALAMGNNCQGIGATPEGIETNPILYDMLFELPWMDVNNRPTADEWLEDYAYARYGVDKNTAPKSLSALQYLKESVWKCQRNQQGTSEAIILGRPRWTFGDKQRNNGTSLEGTSVSSWSVSSIYWDTQFVLQAADDLYAIKDIIVTEDGRANFDYDFIDVVRQSMVDHAAQLLPLIKEARNSGNNTEYERLYNMFLQLMLDLDEMLSYDENFKLERWTSLARNIAGEVNGTDANDRNWLEWNARTQVTVWSNGNNGLNDYSNRCWAGLIKDYHYPRWKYFFENNGGIKDGNWFTSEKAWTVDFTNYDYSTVTIPQGKTATEKAAETFSNYFGRVKGATKNYIFPMGVATNATKSEVTPVINRGQTIELPLIIGKDVEVSSVWVDLNNDGAKGNGETLTATDNQVAIPANAKIGKTTAQVVYSDGTDITFNIALVEEITENRTVTAVAGDNGSVAIEGTNELSITNAEAVKMTATANTGYNFENWTDEGGNVVSNDNPYIYYGKEAATFTANFIQDKWGVPTEDKGDWSNNTVKTSFVNQITFAYHDREPETIYEASVAPENLFNTIPQIINVPRGASFDITWSDDNNNGLKYCYLSAYYDYDGDGVFELLETKGKRTPDLANDGSNNLSVCDGKINVLLPYDAPLGITHMRLRFDGGWKTANFNATTKAYDAKAQLNRMCYELIINVTEGSDKAAHIVVESNNDEWGTAEVWTEETPGWTASNEWDVSTGIEAKIKATKASKDVEFLGWYDHYGRLLTTELQYEMLAREDATYTARFRKALEIDGWQFEYRTEPGSDVVTNKLANGVKPEAGKTYYIYAPTRPTNDGEYVNRYLYNNSGTLTLSTTESTAASYLWVCGVEDGKYTFQNVADPTKYLMHKGLSNSSYGFELGTGTTYYEGLTLQSVPGNGESRNLFFVINDNGSGFNQSTRAHDQSTEDYTTDFVFTEVKAPEVVVLTRVRKNGDHELEIPETVEILGEQCKIVGFDNNLFKNNKDLWTISLPQSMKFLSEKSLFNHTLTGNGSTQTFDVDIKNNEGWRITMDVKRTGELTGWGSCLIASGNTPTKGDNETYAEGFQFYLQAPNNKKENDKLIIKTKTQIYDNWYFDDIYQEASFKVIITYNGAQQLSVNVLKADGTNATNHNGTQEPIVFTDCTIQDIEQLCTNVQSTITAHVEIDKAAESDPFLGCSNLFNITVANGCTNYRVEDRKLYNASDYVLHTLADAEKADEIRALGELIDNTQDLMDEIATSVDPVGKATEIALQTTEGQHYYIWCNNPHDSGDDAKGGVAALLDEDPQSFLHTDYTNKSASHDYLQVNFGSAEGLTNFKIEGQQRHNGSNDRPKNIEIYGSNDNSDWTLITTVEGLPNTAGATWSSTAISSDVKYAYLKFVVKTHDNYNQTSSVSRPYFHMAKFDLFKLTSTVEVATEYQDLAGITNADAANVYDNMVNALYVYNNGGTVAELQAAYDVLKPLYDALNDKKNALQYISQLNELVENTDALINKIATSVEPVGKATEITLSTTEGKDNYIWCNAPQAGSNVGELLDNDPATFFHSNWQSSTAPADGLDHHLTIEDVDDIVNLQFHYQARAGSNLGDFPTTIKVQGSNDGVNYTDIATVQPRNANGDVINYSAEWTSEILGNGNKYSYLRFMVTATTSNRKADGHIYWHMAEFDLYKVTSVVEVAPGYKTLGGITNEEATAAYDLMVKAQALCNNGGTTAELEATLTDLQTAYDALNAKQGKVLNGVYHINYNGAPTFVAYSPSMHENWGLTGATEGYRMFDATTDNTDDRYKTIQDNAIAEKVVADELFTIVPNSSGTGYTISAQGLYMQTTSVVSQWCVQSFSTDEANAGVYEIEQVSDGVFKLKSFNPDLPQNWANTEYVNDWGPVFGNDMSSKPNLSTFSFTPVTEYTLAVPASGYTTLCLPFNVVLPEGVEAYDINNPAKQALVTGEDLLTKIAGANDIVQAGTPMIIKATEGNHTLAITMDSEDAKTSEGEPILRGSYVKQQLAYDANQSKYVLNGKVWEKIDKSTNLPANNCWIEANIDYDYNIDLDPKFVEFDGWKFRYEPATNGIMLTDAAVSGNGNLVIPSSVNIEGKQTDVVAISPDFLHNNKTLTSIEFPATMVNLGFRKVEPMFGDETTVYEGEEGDGATYNGNQLVGEAKGLNREYVFPTNPLTGKPFMVESSFAWRLTLDVTIDDPKFNYNNWGSAIVSTNENSLADSYTNGDMQIYMKANHSDIIVKIDNADDRYSYTLPELVDGKETANKVVHNHFVFELEHDGSGGYQVVIYYDDGRSKMYNISASEGAIVKNFDRFYYSLPKGIRVKVKVEKLYSEGLFVGCTNLTDINVHSDNKTFKSSNDGVLYDKKGYYVMRIPEGGTDHYEIPSKVVKLYPGAVHGVAADVVLHSNPQIGVVDGHEEHVKNVNFYLSLDDIDNTIESGETGYLGARDFVSTNLNTYKAARYKRAQLGKDNEGNYMYGTIMLPFVPDNAMAKYDFFEFEGGDATSLIFSQVDEKAGLKVNTPYLYKMKEDFEYDPDASEDIFETYSEFTVAPVAKYNPNDETPGSHRALGALVNHYIETKNYPNSSYYYFNTKYQEFRKVTEKLNYRPFRAIFVMTPEQEGQAAQAPARLSLRLLDGTTTDIDASLVEDMVAPEYYDLYGRRVLNPISGGVYIVNGQKVVVK